MPSAEEIESNRRHYATVGGEPALDLQRSLLSSDEFRTRRVLLNKISRLGSNELDGPRLVFIHIEKCAGTTLHQMLASQFDPARICPERYDALGNWTINELAAYDLFSGHFDLACCRSIPGTLRILTMLREPKARLLSLFQFWKSHRPHPERDLYNLLLLARETTAEEFFCHPDVVRHRNIRDAMTGQLLRTSDAMQLTDDDPMVREPGRMLERACRAIEDLSGFGITERFEESRLLLNRQLGLEMTPIEPRQVLARLLETGDEFLPVAHEPVTDRLSSLLDALTGIDRPLYARALKLFEARLLATFERPSRLRQVAARVWRAGAGGET